MKKIALVTGSAIRIGKEIVKSLAKNNWIVVVQYCHSKEQAIELQNEIGANIHIKYTDLNDEDQIRELVKSINEEIGEIELLINNAAIFENDNIDNFSTGMLQKHINVNLIAPVLLIQEFKNQYKGNRGNIINMLDYSVKKLPDKFLSYNISKSAMWAATQMLAQELAPNIRVNAIGPGPTLINERQSDEHFKKSCENTLLKRGCALEEICNTINYIINTHSLTGQIILLDSGKHLGDYGYS